MVFSEIKLDLLFARLNPQHFEDNDFENLAMSKSFKWQNMDRQSLASFGGVKVVLSLLKAVPNE
jgi:poly(A) polymerase Pap1